MEGDATSVEELLQTRGLRKADRHYMAKHPDLLPPAPTLANPVVRKAIHEVRRHVIAYLRTFNRPPDRVVVELARQAKQSERVRQAALDRNRYREKIRKAITEEFNLVSRTPNQQRAAQDRVILARQQRNVCAYSGKAITDRQAAAGDDLEIDHIIPYSVCGMDNLNNKVLCYRESNHDKRNQTPRQWWGDSFDDRIRPMKFMEGNKAAKGEKNAYFSDRDYAAKWENLNRIVRPEDEWKNSQLTDTAYASRQVMSYLRDALFQGRKERDRGVFATNGRYTARLRRDWQLGFNGAVKDRSDHRHHAIDAVAIALTDPHRLLSILASLAADDEECHNRTGRRPSRTPVPPPKPWETPEQLQKQVAQAVQNLIVAHRPVKRRLVGAFHEETLFGPVAGSEEFFTNRIAILELKPNHLRPPGPKPTSKQPGDWSTASCVGGHRRRRRTTRQGPSSRTQASNDESSTRRPERAGSYATAT